jgi:glycosyltransferase involved in cell wall biosynthesis
MKQKIKVAIDIRDLRISKSGANTYLREIINQMKQGSEKFEYLFFDSFLPAYSGKNTFLKSCEHALFFFWKQIGLPIRASLKGCKIIFCTDYFVPYFSLGCKTIPVFHDAFFWEFPQHYSKPWLLILQYIGLPAARKAPYVVTVSAYSKLRIAKFTGLEIEKIIPIYLAPKSIPVHQENDSEPINQKWIPLLSKKYILHVGTLEKRKNIGTLITAFQLLIEAGDQETHLVLVGQRSNKSNDSEKAIFQKIEQDVRLKDRVHFTGYLNTRELFEFYTHALLYVFPSTNEGFGLPVLEAFECKVPLIIANSTCLPEIAGNAALSFDPNNSDQLFNLMQSLLADDFKRNDLIEKGSDRLQQFSWHTTLTELEQVFNKALP